MVRTRFAPSPTGYMHLGGLRTALYAYLFARKNEGVFILRIEDTDTEREVPGAVDKIYEAMKLAGLMYDEGPDVGGEYGPYIQTQRRDLYPGYAQQLVEKGAAYYCFCTKQRLDEARAEAEKNGQTFKYDKHCLNMSKEEIQQKLDAGESYVIRQNIPLTGMAGFDDALYGRVEVECSTLDDNVLIKGDGLPTYNFANVVDDHLMSITHVMRGTEYLSSAPKYNLLYEAFGWDAPIYVHLPVVMADSTRKLSKRHGDPTFEDLLDQGYLKDAIVNFIALLGWSPRSEEEFFTLDDLVKRFDFEGINKAPSIFDKNKLIWFNAEYIRRLSEQEFLEYATPWMKKGLNGASMDYAYLARLLHNRTEVFSQIPGLIDFLVEMPEFDTALYTHKKMKTNPEIALDALLKIEPVLDAIDDWSEANIHSALTRLIEQMGVKNGQVFWPARIAISGKESTPGGAIEIAYLLGKNETLSRMRRSIAALRAELS